MTSRPRLWMGHKLTKKEEDGKQILESCLRRRKEKEEGVQKILRNHHGEDW